LPFKDAKRVVSVGGLGHPHVTIPFILRILGIQTTNLNQQLNLTLFDAIDLQNNKIKSLLVLGL